MCVPIISLSGLFVFISTVLLSRAENDNIIYTTLTPIVNESFTTVPAFPITPASIYETEADPYGAFSGFYSECLMRLSYSCFQRKVLVFLDRLDKKKKINLYGHWLELVRSSEPTTLAITEQMLVARKATDEHTLSSLLELAWEQFVDNRFIRLQLPDLDRKNDRRSVNYIDINVSGHTTDEFEGRGKKKKKKKLGKIIKKLMSIIGKIAVLKLLLLKPLIFKLVAIKASKALILAKISFILSKIMIIKKLMKMKNMKMMGGGCSCGGGKGGGKGGGGGCGCGGHGGGGGYPPSGVSDGDWMGGGGGGGGWDSSGGGGGGGGGGWMTGGSGGGGSGGGWDRSFAQNAAYSYYQPYSTIDSTKGDVGQSSYSSLNSVQNTYFPNNQT